MPTTDQDVLISPDALEEEQFGGPPPEDPPETRQWNEFEKDGWESEVRELAQRDTDVKWAVGDCLVKAEPHYAHAYEHAARITGLTKKTLQDWATTARRATVRTVKLSWSHHRVLVNTRPNASKEKMKDWLEQAVAEDLSVAAFQETIKTGVGPAPTYKKSFLVTVPLGVWEALKDTADGDGSTVQEYAAELLSGFAASDDGVELRETAKEKAKDRRHKQRQEHGRRTARDHNPLRMER